MWCVRVGGAGGGGGGEREVEEALVGLGRRRNDVKRRERERERERERKRVFESVCAVESLSFLLFLPNAQIQHPNCNRKSIQDLSVLGLLL